MLESCKILEDEGFEVTYLPVESGTGLVDLDKLRAAMRPDTLLCSIIHVNNEIGVAQPLKEIGKICRANKTFFGPGGPAPTSDIMLKNFQKKIFDQNLNFQTFQKIENFF